MAHETFSYVLFPKFAFKLKGMKHKKSKLAIKKI